MLKTRIIPCLDVADGRVVKGVNFVDLIDAGDPVEQPEPMTPRARTSCVSSTSTPRTRTAARCMTSPPARPEQLLHAADDRRRPCARSRMCATCCWRAPTRSASTPPPWPTRMSWPAPPTSSGRNASWWPIDAKTVAPGRGKSSPTAGASPPHRRTRVRQDESSPRARGEILLTSMDRDGTKQGFNIPLTRAIADACPVPVIASGGVGRSNHLVEGVTEGTRAPFLAASIFHFGTLFHRRGPRPTWPPPASP